MILADWEIQDYRPVDPVLEKTKINDGPSFGLSSYGYDIRLGTRFIRFDTNGKAINEERPKLEPDIIGHNPNYEIPSGGFVLAESEEWFTMPSTITGMVKDKSTYARRGIAVQNTVIEAGWHGRLTLEISNHSPIPVKLFVGQGIAQVLFFRGTRCDSPYEGKYQGDTKVSQAR
ncbi:MAG: dCTP deaminase [Nitrosopumilaceae archaeon]|nr:dCTP deaminase [Nitrosopumilaceae archaeon]NIT99844.1 dCTP deaminase [Nitrosopumilaceae archaeon]NIU86207.1 dCTP deaminase [Nitrosopumilaceae archaeon]NIV64969.1 dCTP deaminase [Nitrosopumilaceae archaeon]NIX60447.1 dCTP deaminase [Nitrosopumilaceae archaeon]